MDRISHGRAAFKTTGILKLKGKNCIVDSFLCPGKFIERNILKFKLNEISFRNIYCVELFNELFFNILFIISFQFFSSDK